MNRRTLLGLLAAAPLAPRVPAAPPVLLRTRSRSRSPGEYADAVLRHWTMEDVLAYEGRLLK